MSAIESCSVGVVLDGASAEELQLLDSFLQSHSLLKTSGEVAPGNIKMAGDVEDLTWGGTFAKVCFCCVCVVEGEGGVTGWDKGVERKWREKKE